jgi:hypothetical protein
LEKWSGAVGKTPKTYRVKLAGKNWFTTTADEHAALVLHLLDPDTLHWVRRGAIFRTPGGQKIVLKNQADTDAVIKALDPKVLRYAEILRAELNRVYGDDFMPVWEHEEGYSLPQRDLHWSRIRLRPTKDADVPLWSDDADTRVKWLKDNDLFHERKGGTDDILLLPATHSFVANVTKLAAYAGKAASVYDARLLLNDSKFRDALTKRARFPVDRIKDWMDTIEDFQGKELRSSSPVAEAGRQVIRGFHAAALGLKAHIIIGQELSYMTAWAAGIPIEHIAANAKYLVPFVSSKQAEAEIKQWQPILKARIEGSGHGMITPWASANLVREAAGFKESARTRWAMGPIHRADTKTIAAIWSAVKDWGKAQGMEGDALMRWTAEKAVEIIDSSQPTWDPTTSSQLARSARQGDLFNRFATMFTSVTNKNFNMAMRAVADYRAGDIGVGDLTKRMTVPLLLNTALYSAISQGTMAAWRLLWGARSKEDWADRFAKFVGRVLGQWLFFGDIADLVLRHVYAGVRGRSAYNVKQRATPIGTVVDQGLRMIDATVAIAKEPDAASLAKAAAAAAEFAGTVTGTPTHGPLQVIRPGLPKREKSKKPKGGGQASPFGSTGRGGPFGGRSGGRGGPW